jgi:hypothetical protein
MAISLDPASVAQIERVLARDRAAMPVADALTRRLGVESWLMTLGPDGRLRAVTVLADVLPPVAPVPTPRAAVAAHPLDRLLALPPAGVLVRVLGAPTATGRQLADLALRRDDADVRAEAVQVAVDAMMRDPALEGALLGTLEHVDDGALAQALVGAAGDAAPALLAIVAERARGRPLGWRAAAVLVRLGASSGKE